MSGRAEKFILQRFRIASNPCYGLYDAPLAHSAFGITSRRGSRAADVGGDSDFDYHCASWPSKQFARINLNHLKSDKS